jgi:O-antigen ligase
MIFYYVLVLSLPLVSHSVFSSEAAGVTVIKYLGVVCLAYALLSLPSLRRPPEFLATPQSRSFLAFFVLVLLSYLLHAPTPVTTRSALVTNVSHVAFFVTTLVVVSSLERLRRVLLVAIASMALASLYVLRDWQGGSAVYGTGYRPGYVTGDPNFYAASAVLCLPLAFGWVLERRPAWERLFCLGCVLVGLAGSMVAASRGGFVGLVAATAFMIWHAPRRARNFTLMAGTLLVFLAVSPTSPLQRLMNPRQGDEDATEARLQIWTVAMTMVKEHPLTGVGIGNFKASVAAYGDLPADLQLAAHNGYLDVAAEMGVPGLLALVLTIYWSCRGLGRVRRQARQQGPPLLHQTALGMQAGLIGFAVALMFVSGLFLKVFWLMVFLSMCVPRLRPAERFESRREAA